jgi:hypothetical protein
MYIRNVAGPAYTKFSLKLARISASWRSKREILFISDAFEVVPLYSVTTEILQNRKHGISVCFPPLMSERKKEVQSGSKT